MMHMLQNRKLETLLYTDPDHCNGEDVVYHPTLVLPGFPTPAMVIPSSPITAEINQFWDGQA